MLLQHLKDFEWINEPLGVFFIDEGMKVLANAETGFSPKTDTGHFFFIRKQEDFTLIVKWQVEAISPLVECGIMIRQDEKNWAKTHLTHTKTHKLSSTVLIHGNADESINDITLSQNELFYKLEKTGDSFTLSYSQDNLSYHQIRHFSFLDKVGELKIGAYICNPKNSDFEAVLNYLEVL
ncbi:MAG: DUF1349 domain-containing protein [Alphaproteobacteria bacterium]|nr:DUF1349 domain-containing protein [Alphaproteobacteria bacterium]